jgi:hypothetical protein
MSYRERPLSFTESAPGTYTYTFAYAYDAVGNRTAGLTETRLLSEHSVEGERSTSGIEGKSP